MGNYRLLKTIGKGNFAKVKLARHILTGREVSRAHARERMSRSRQEAPWIGWFLFSFCQIVHFTHFPSLDLVETFV